MLKSKIEKLKNIFIKKSEGNNKKRIENLVVFLVLLIITIIAINTIWGEKSKKDSSNSTYKQLADTNSNVNSNIGTNNEYNLEENLKQILSKISGVGQVDVLLTYSQTSQVIPIYNESSKNSSTEETDTNGGVRTIEESDSNKEVVMINDNGTNTPITSKTLTPKVEGAIIIAKGAKDINIKTNIINAVSAVTGLAEYKVQVFEMN